MTKQKIHHLKANGFKVDKQQVSSGMMTTQNSNQVLCLTGSTSLICTPPSSNKYQSHFCPSNLHQSRLSKNELTYDSFEFKKTTVSVGSDGKSTVTVHPILQTILVVQGWQAHKKGGVPQDGYIGKGLSKYAFWVSTNSQIQISLTHHILGRVFLICKSMPFYSVYQFLHQNNTTWRTSVMDLLFCNWCSIF